MNLTKNKLALIFVNLFPLFVLIVLAIDQYFVIQELKSQNDNFFNKVEALSNKIDALEQEQATRKKIGELLFEMDVKERRLNRIQNGEDDDEEFVPLSPEEFLKFLKRHDLSRGGKAT